MKTRDIELMSWTASEVQTGAAVAQAIFALLLIVAIVFEVVILMKHRKALQQTADAQKEVVLLQQVASDQAAETAKAQQRMLVLNEQANKRAAELAIAQFENYRATGPQVTIIHPAFHRNEQEVSFALAATHAGDVVRNLRLQVVETLWYRDEGDLGAAENQVGRSISLPDGHDTLLKTDSLVPFRFDTNDIPRLAEILDLRNRRRSASTYWEDGAVDADFDIKLYVTTKLGAKDNRSITNL